MKRKPKSFKARRLNKGEIIRRKRISLSLKKYWRHVHLLQKQRRLVPSTARRVWKYRVPFLRKKKTSFETAARFLHMDCEAFRIYLSKHSPPVSPHLIIYYFKNHPERSRSGFETSVRRWVRRKGMR